MQQLSQECDKLKKQNKIYEAENRKLNDQINSMLSKDTDTSMHVLKQTKTITKLEAELNQLKDQSRDLTSVLEQKAAENQSLKNQVNDAKILSKQQANLIKKDYKHKLTKCIADKNALFEYNQELEFKNQQLATVLNSKTNEIKEYLRRVETSCLEKSEIMEQNEYLDSIIAELQQKNQDLTDMMNKQLHNQINSHAEKFKNRALTTLTKGQVSNEVRNQVYYHN